MSISADIVLIKKYNGEKIKDNDDICVFNLKNNYGNSIIKEIQELYGEDVEYVQEKTICYIGDGYCFKKGILDDYENNIGVMKLKNNYHLIKNEDFERISKFLENKFQMEIKYILEKEDLYINLCY